MQDDRGISRSTEEIEVEGETVEVDLLKGDLWAVVSVRVPGERPIRPTERSHPTKTEALEEAHTLALKILRS